MNIAFYIDEMNYRGVANSTYQFALNNQNILKNKSIIFYNKNNYRNKREVIKKFKKKFRITPISRFEEINNYKKKNKIKFIYVQKSGNKDHWISHEIKTIVHSVYPQRLNEIHGFNYAYISEWLSNQFSNKKIQFVPLITETIKTKKNLRKYFKIKKNSLVFGCHGGDSSFDMKFTQTAILKAVDLRKDISFLFLNINKFCNHPRIKFLKGTSDEIFKKKFINSCDAMIYGRSLGESFGLACGEFAIENKEIISYKYNRHKSHEHNILSKNLIKYGSYSNLLSILLKYKKKPHIENYRCKYRTYTKKKVMKIFSKSFLQNNKPIQITVFDNILNYFNFLKMSYFYLRHKIYNYYFKYIELKFINLKD